MFKYAHINITVHVRFTQVKLLFLKVLLLKSKPSGQFIDKGIRSVHLELHYCKINEKKTTLLSKP